MWHSLSGHAAHFILELLAYFIGAQIYWRTSRHEVKPPPLDRWLIFGAATFGAMVGSKLLHVLEHLPYLIAQQNTALWVAGKSVLGGFLGGTLGVEIAKKCTGWKTATGDAWVPALAAGLVIGRIGCQLSGTWDETYGTPTALPWAWDYGDGRGRHPTGLYEIALITAAFFTTRFMRYNNASLKRSTGASFALFMLCYCAIRFGLEWLKPPFGAAAVGTLPVALYCGLTAIQWAALIGFTWYGLLLQKRLQRSKTDS